MSCAALYKDQIVILTRKLNSGFPHPVDLLSVSFWCTSLMELIKNTCFLVSINPHTASQPIPVSYILKYFEISPKVSVYVDVSFFPSWPKKISFCRFCVCVLPSSLTHISAPMQVWSLHLISICYWYDRLKPTKIQCSSLASGGAENNNQIKTC